jgi:hypothetical protein
MNMSLKLSVSLDYESVLLMQHLKMTGETTSAFLRRMIKEVAKQHGLSVETRVIQK